VYQVLRREAKAEWADISEETLLRELRQKGCVNPYAIAARLKAGDPLLAQSTRYRWTGEIVLRNLTKRTIANSAHAAYGA
jgi:phosphohistidine phosphatase SixA